MAENVAVISQVGFCSDEGEAIACAARGTIVPKINTLFSKIERIFFSRFRVMLPLGLTPRTPRAPSACEIRRGQPLLHGSRGYHRER